MPYTMEDFQREVREKVLSELTVEERQKILRELTVEERQKVLRRWALDEWLAGLSQDELTNVKQTLERLSGASKNKSSF